VWDADTGKPIGEPLTGHTESVFSPEFSPNGKRIVTASKDKTARIWDVDAGKAIGEPLRGQRCLTPAQRWAFFLPPELPSGASSWRSGPTTPTNGISGSVTPAPARTRRSQLPNQESGGDAPLRRSFCAISLSSKRIDLMAAVIANTSASGEHAGKNPPVPAAE